MKTCRKCGEEFDEGDNEHDPVTGLDDIFVESMSGSRPDELCPKCRKDLAVTMKTCRRCGQEFEEDGSEHNSVTELGDMFLKGTT